ncbi:carbohydrate ABC transporter permease [Butyrivibrio fibrisolvens]|jgi:ABC-type sugar transport system permease subunit|uniref:Carbohydrate ABC transporter membrane protein 1, CUT1 family n=2 Tax=Butyrivibrio fibrisolvens TaxID=831 RepID=A0A1H9QU24_BUTFI|nr:sugar ABC transporter permease [Butyrivibrio fibrisolvens]SER63930.1 carbohydrate ABC transporter membrane protein 1, CUT1 family [Butyrivibrio fibrisolvens]SHI11410.1 ABC-type sugar transport system, permease component [Butyrivibrio fibrisolvens DSM 3071]
MKIFGKKEKKPRIKLGKLESREARMGYLFVAPWLVGVLAFLLIPLAQSFYYMWYNIRITPNGMKFTFLGTGNFTQIWLENPEFPQQLVTYIWQTLIEVPIIVVFALMIAIMLNGKIVARGFFRLIFFLPVIIVSGPVMNLLVSEGASSIPAMDTQAIVSAMETVLPASAAEGIGEIFSNMIMTLWYSGVQILIFLSALQKVDPSMYEAAKIDGGSEWECFWKITLPTIKPMILLCSVYSVIFLSGNEQNELITMIKDAMFSGTKEKGYGYASAMAWMYALVITLITLLFFLLLGSKKDHYDRLVKKHQKQLKKEEREAKRIERRGRRNAARMEKIQRKGKFTTYDGSGDY